MRLLPLHMMALLMGSPTQPRSGPRAARAASILPVCLLLAAGCSGRPGEEPQADLPDVSVEGVEEEHHSLPVAVVNGTEIYRAHYEQILTFLRDRIEAGQEGSVEKYLGARGDALERAIDMELLYQEAVRRGYGLDAAELQTEYAKRVARAGSEEKYLADAHDQFFSKSEVLGGIRRELAVERFVADEVDSRLSVTDSDVRSYYDDHPEQFQAERAVRLSGIFVEAPQGSSREERAAALTRISTALERLRNGESFSDVAADISEDEVASSGGRLGVVKLGTLPEPLNTAAFSLNEGEVSGILQSESGYHLLLIHEKMGGGQKPFEEVADQIRDAMLGRGRNRMLAAIVRGLRREATIERKLR